MLKAKPVTYQKGNVHFDLFDSEGNRCVSLEFLTLGLPPGFHERKLLLAPVEKYADLFAAAPETAAELERVKEIYEKDWAVFNEHYDENKADLKAARALNGEMLEALEDVTKLTCDILSTSAYKQDFKELREIKASLAVIAKAAAGASGEGDGA